MKKNSLFKNYIYNWISQILSLLVPLLTAPYLARVLHEAGNGQIAFVHSIVAYFASFAAFGFSIYGQREIARHQNNEKEQSRFFWEIFLLKCVLSVMSLAVLYLLVLLGAFQRQYTVLILLDSIQVIAVIFDIQFYYQGVENFRAIAIRTIVLRVLVILSVFLFIRTEQDVWVYILLYALSIFASNISMWPPVLRHIHLEKGEKLQILRHLRPAFFIFLPVISGTILSFLDETMIGYLSQKPDYHNGCYGSALKLVTMLTMLVSVDTQVLASRNAVDYAKNDTEAIKRHLDFGVRYVWILACPIAAGLLILADHLSAWFFGAGFELVPPLLRIFTVRLVAQGLMFVLGNQYFIQTGREKLCTAVNFVGIAMNILVNALLIPRFGSIGACVASVASESVMYFVFAFFFHRDTIGREVQILPSIRNYLTAALLMSVPVYLLSRITGWTFFSFLLVTGAGALVYFAALFALKDAFFLRYFKVCVNKILKHRG